MSWYDDAFSQINWFKHHESDLAAKMADIAVHDHIFGNWVIPLATFRTLETALDVPFSYNELFDTSVNACLNRTSLGRKVQIKKKNVNRPKALCFDYLQLKETFGIDLETEVLVENEE